MCYHVSEGEAYNRIEVARAARRFPVILEMLSAGEIYLWSVRLLAPHLTAENHMEVLQSARGKKAKLAVQEIVARLAPRPDVPTTIWKAVVPAPPEPAPVASPEADEPTPVRAPGFQAVLPGNGVAPSVYPAVITPAAVTPLSPDRYKIQLTIGGDTLEKLRLAKDMLSHAVPSGDDAAVLDRALSALLVELAKKKFAQTRRRRSRGCKDDSDISAAVKCVVYVRDRGRCTFVGAHGHRCEERRYVQFHHIDARARGGKATPDKITLRCRAHNDYEGRLLFGKRRRNDGAAVVKEDRPAYGSLPRGGTNSFRNEFGGVTWLLAARPEPRRNRVDANR